MSPIITDRLIIRTPRAADLDDVLAYRNHPAIVGGGSPMEPMASTAPEHFWRSRASLIRWLGIAG